MHKTPTLTCCLRTHISIGVPEEKVRVGLFHDSTYDELIRTCFTAAFPEYPVPPHLNDFFLHVKNQHGDFDRIMRTGDIKNGDELLLAKVSAIPAAPSKRRNAPERGLDSEAITPSWYTESMKSGKYSPEDVRLFATYLRGKDTFGKHFVFPESSGKLAEPLRVDHPSQCVSNFDRLKHLQTNEGVPRGHYTSVYAQHKYINMAAHSDPQFCADLFEDARLPEGLRKFSFTDAMNRARAICQDKKLLTGHVPGSGRPQTKEAQYSPDPLPPMEPNSSPPPLSTVAPHSPPAAKRYKRNARNSADSDSTAQATSVALAAAAAALNGQKSVPSNYSPQLLSSPVSQYDLDSLQLSSLNGVNDPRQHIMGDHDRLMQQADFASQLQQQHGHMMMMPMMNGSMMHIPHLGLSNQGPSYHLGGLGHSPLLPSLGNGLQGLQSPLNMHVLSQAQQLQQQQRDLHIHADTLAHLYSDQSLSLSHQGGGEITLSDGNVGG